MCCMQCMNRHHGCVDLQQLRYVVAVADERSFTRAAERCFVVQSALSHQIKALEREIGMQLFARTSRRVEITSAGEAFVAAARQSIEAADRAVTEAAAAGGQVRGTLTIGLIPTVTAIDVPALLGAFNAKHPQVRIALRQGGSAEFTHAIRAGTVDVAFLGLKDGDEPPGVAYRELSREALVAVLPASHALAARTRVSLSALADEPFVDFPASSSGRAQTDAAFAVAGLERDVAFEAMSPELMLDLIRHRLAIALLPAAVVPEDRSLAVVRVTDAPRRAEYVAWSAFNPGPAARAFVDAVGMRE